MGAPLFLLREGLAEDVHRHLVRQGRTNRSSAEGLESPFERELRCSHGKICGRVMRKRGHGRQCEAGGRAVLRMGCNVSNISHGFQKSPLVALPVKSTRINDIAMV